MRECGRLEAAWVAAMGIVGWLVVAVCLSGCAGGQGLDTTRAVLDAYATTARTLQEIVVVTCDTVARVEIERASTREEAERAEREVSERCGAVYQVFRAIQASHQSASQMVAMIEAGRAESSDLIALLVRLGNLVQEGHAAWAQLREVLRERGHDPPGEVTSYLHKVDDWAAAERARWAL
jgi:hypothetical protein